MRLADCIHVACPQCAVVLVVPVSVTADGATLSLTADAEFLAAHVAVCAARPREPGPEAPRRGVSAHLPPLS